MTTVAARTAPASSFDRSNWPPAVAQIAAASVELAFAVAVWPVTAVGPVLAGLLVVDVAAQLLPWRYPRSGRSAVSIWAEVLLYLAVPTAALAVAVATGQPWATRTGHPAWYAVAAAVGVALVWAGGTPLRALLSGDLAFLAPPVSRRHKWARCVSAAAAPPGEEMLFRAPVLAAAGPGAAAFGLLAGAAFVARHHLPPGLHERTSTRTLLARIAAAAALLALTWAAHSVFPALLAHYVNNAPSFLLELQRRTEDAA
jgi:CAAX prenyl protease-like protein